MVRGLSILTVLAVSGGVLCGAALASPVTSSTPPETWPCFQFNSSAPDQSGDDLALAIESMTEVCQGAASHDQGLLARAVAALRDWIAARGTSIAADHQARFFRALAALEAETDLYSIDGIPGTANSALMLDPFHVPGAETALFTVEEATIPFLGYSDDDGMRVLIAIDAPGYRDLFTIYFPRGTAHLTLPAEDMIALAAMVARDYDEAEIWVSPGPALTTDLAFDRVAAIQDILLQNDVPGDWIHVDDGGIDAIMDRPEQLNGDMEI